MSNKNKKGAVLRQRKNGGTFPESSASPFRGRASRQRRTPCFGFQKLFERQACLLRYPFEKRRLRPVDVVHEIRNRRLADPNAVCEVGLRDSVFFQVVAECFHQGPDAEGFVEAECIGFAYRNAIGQSYPASMDNVSMAKQQERSFLDRAMEALAERYPREKATQLKLAKLAGVSQPSVNEWREVGRGPAIPTGRRLALALGVCMEWLYTERGPKRPGAAADPDEHLSPILEAWPNLPAELRRQLARFTDFIRGDDKPE
jgi:hypothetical protein